jgi:hypothetical protein
MVFHPANLGSVVAFIVLCAGVVAALLAGVGWSARQAGVPPGRRLMPVAVGLAAWLGTLALVVQSGFVAAAPMPRLLFLFAGIGLVSVGVGLSAVGRWLAVGVPVAWLVAFQGFRLPLELILHSWANQGTIPTTMTWTGRNWDIVSGVVALLVAPLAGRSRAASWFANATGIVLLLNVGRVAVLSSPVPFGWQVEPPLLLAFHLPYALILPVCVGGAALGHVVLTRALLRR